MPVVGTPVINTSAPVISRTDVRTFLRDFANNNILLDDVEFQDADIDAAISFATDEYNAIVPITSVTSATIPKSILMLGTAAWLMRSESFLQIRNQATYQDGDVAPIGIDDKMQFFSEMSKTLKQEWKETARAYKIQLNMEAGYGSLSSGYRNTGRFHQS